MTTTTQTIDQTTLDERPLRAEPRQAAAFAYGRRPMTDRSRPTWRARSRGRAVATAVVVACAALAVAASTALASTGEGGLDPAFGAGGLTISSVNTPNPQAEVYSSGITDPSQTFALFGANNPSGFGGAFGLVRFDAQGHLASSMPSFSASSPDISHPIRPVALLAMPDGFFIAVGSQTDAGGDSHIVLARFNADGTADSGFSLQVVPVTQCPNHPGGPGFGNFPTAAIPAHHSNLIVVGSCGAAPAQPAAWQFDEQGHLLSVSTIFSFTANGAPPGFKDIVNFTATAVGGAFGTDDWVVGNFEGHTLNGSDQQRVFIAKLTNDTGFDRSFGEDGDYTLNALGAGNPAYYSGIDGATAVATDPNGQPVLAGYSQGAAGGAIAVERFTTDGRPDTSFGNGDQRVIPVSGFGKTHAVADAIAIRADGKIWLSGPLFDEGAADHSSLAVVRLGPDGADDDTFGRANNGQQTYPLPAGHFAAGNGRLSLEADGFPVVAEDGTHSAGADFVLARVTSAEACTLCGLVVARNPPRGPITFTVLHGPGGPAMGILVRQRQRGKTVTLGRVPFGPQRLGRVVLRWNRRVAGRPLKPGSYLIIVRALDQHRHVVALSNPIRLVIRR